jgi:hypothetical protein
MMLPAIAVISEKCTFRGRHSFNMRTRAAKISCTLQVMRNSRAPRSALGLPRSMCSKQGNEGVEIGNSVLARWQYDQVHRDMIYDWEIDTTATTPPENAQKICDAFGL